MLARLSAQWLRLGCDWHFGPSSGEPRWVYGPWAGEDISWERISAGGKTATFDAHSLFP